MSSIQDLYLLSLCSENECRACINKLISVSKLGGDSWLAAF
jgi:hypothetical protein